MIFIKKKQTTKILQLVAGCTSNLAHTATEIWLIGATLALGTLPRRSGGGQGTVTPHLLAAAGGPGDRRRLQLGAWRYVNRRP